MLGQRAFRTKYPNEKAPSHSAIINLVSAFKQTGSVNPRPPKPKQPSQKRIAAQNQLKTMVSDFKNFSTRKAAVAIGVSQSFILSILHDDFHFMAYKYHLWHKLEENDHEKRIKFAE